MFENNYYNTYYDNDSLQWLLYTKEVCGRPVGTQKLGFSLFLLFIYIVYFFLNKNNDFIQLK